MMSLNKTRAKTRVNKPQRAACTLLKDRLDSVEYRTAGKDKSNTEEQQDIPANTPDEIIHPEYPENSPIKIDEIPVYPPEEAPSNYTPELGLKITR